jgi:deoxycytidine triphosphate deaminase
VYLSDRDIKALLPVLDIETEHPAHAFDADEQIQPCSIDLRISNHFWKPSRRRYWGRRPLRPGRPAIDLREAHMNDLDPRRDWRPVVLGEGDVETIRPGQMLMGRVYERFAIPSTCAGKIEGRSSFARLGLFVHSTGDFINPGWSGYMPLQLYNAGPYPIRITPYLPICQLKLVQLSSEPDRQYGQEELQSKYVNDDGGPSFWWRDRRVRALQTRLGDVHAPVRLVQEVVDIVRFEDPELLARFQGFVADQRVQQLQSADDLLSRFVRRETWRRRFDRARIGAFVLFAGGTIGSLFSHPIGFWHKVIWLATAATTVLAAQGLSRSDTDYLTERELREARTRRQLERPQ